ncbi:MAG: MATE family efflux transporter, partial [Bacteroidaceae bacterium]|nr:MATE family efflux transporter [Bacteroidaceae bacterium]
MRLYYPQEYRTLTKLGIPLAIGQIGLTLQNLADNIMLGQHSTQELAAAGFVNSLVVLVLLLTIGYSMGSISQIGA